MGKQDPQPVEEAGFNLGISIQVITTRTQKCKEQTLLQGRSVDSPFCQQEVSHPFGCKNMNFCGSAAIQHGHISHAVIYFILLSCFLDKLVGHL